jgi:3'(2'), 5'-bisphosphate nucleotidase
MQLSVNQINDIINLTHKVGEEVKRFYYLPDLEVEYKADDSPVTFADKLASKYIINGLNNITPNIPVISEEGDDTESLEILEKHSVYWLVDPIDGTKSFIRKKGDFTINIGLIENGIPKFGIIYQPITGVTYYTDHEENARKIEYGKNTLIRVNTEANPYNGLRILIPNRNLSEEAHKFVSSLNISFSEQIASSLKFCLIAEGKFDIYVNFSRIFLWDVAAGYAILLKAGGLIYGKDGKPLLYLPGSLKNPHFIAFSSSIAQYIRENLASLT